MPRNHLRQPATAKSASLDPAQVRSAIESGARAYEVAERFGITECMLSLFMRRHDIAVLASDRLPPPDLSRPDRIIVWKSIPDPMSGVARRKRFALPRISMQVAAMMETQ